MGDTERLTGWNYRVMRHAERLPPYYALHEVYYAADGRAVTWSESPMEVFGESVADVAEDLRLMLLALKRPVLDFETGLEVENAPACRGDDVCEKP